MHSLRATLLTLSRLLYLTGLCAFLTFPSQVPDSRSVLSESKGTIESNNTYHNTILKMEVPLPGPWHFFDRTMYSAAESKQREKEMVERNRAACRGPLCGEPEIDVALQTDAPFVHAIFLTAYRLSPEYQNRERYPLKRFAQVMTSESTNNQWIPDGELIAIQLGGRPAYRLMLHHSRTVTAKGFAYVADSNGRVFMLLGTAMSEPEKLRSAIESMRFLN
jgi:hypothetical protein